MSFKIELFFPFCIIQYNHGMIQEIKIMIISWNRILRMLFLRNSLFIRVLSPLCYLKE